MSKKTPLYPHIPKSNPIKRTINNPNTPKELSLFKKVQLVLAPPTMAEVDRGETAFDWVARRLRTGKIYTDEERSEEEEKELAEVLYAEEMLKIEERKSMASKGGKRFRVFYEEEETRSKIVSAFPLVISTSTRGGSEDSEDIEAQDERQVRDYFTTYYPERYITRVEKL